MISYAGIGSTSISDKERETIQELAAELCSRFTLYSGHAEGADEAFEKGADGKAAIFLPFKGFNEQIPVSGQVFIEGDSAYGLQAAKRFHPRFHSLKPGAVAMMCRNYHQIFGYPPTYPKVSFVVCCAPPMCDRTIRDFLNGFGDRSAAMIENHVDGGTGHAVRIASFLAIPVFNIKKEGWRHALDNFLSSENIGNRD